MNQRAWIFVGVVVLLVWIFGGIIARFYTDWLWFGEVGYRTVFWTRLITRIEIGIAAGLLFFAIIYSNLWLARRLAPPVLDHYGADTIRLRIGKLARRGFRLLIFLLALGASVLVALEASTHWLEFLSFANSTQFGQTDPLFNKDIGFYIFKLGLLRYIYGWLLFTIVVVAIATAAVHYADRAIEFLAGMPTFAPHVKTHLLALLAAALFVRAWGYRLDAYNLLYSPTGVVYGPGYADVHARLVACQILSVLAMIGGILALISVKRRGIGLPVAALAVLIGASFILKVLYPQFVQAVYVKPDEIRQESKYIAHNIRFTREAFNLDLIEEKNFPAPGRLTPKDIEANRATINSIRLWDYRPLDKTYSQLQELWQFYKISNVDVDRYTLNNELRQVTLAARELSTESLQTRTATWVNRHFQYTHGYGAVMSPVNRATEEGLPDFFVEGLPPVSNVGIDITQPQIYFGEMTNDYVVVNTEEQEFDYPAEGKPIYTRYSGKGGISIGSYLRRLALALRFSDVNLVLKNPVTPQSRMMFRRLIRERVSTIFPFLLYDPDPYLVISNGKLFWMLDAYTVSQKYPYSTPYQVYQGFEVNYMRNPVKVVIDAYDGTVDYYIADSSDPILKTYRKIFPGVFKPIEKMPKDLFAHIRYPELLFKVQSEVLLVYHMQDPKVFYNKGEQWDIPKEIVETNNEQTPMEPYYVVMSLPDKKEEEFLLMRPFTPVGEDKNNMIAWMAAKCGPDDYGKMIVYKFPKKELIYGPAHIESRIRQDSTISPQLSLWNREGSRVNWGNLLVIPIDRSIIYVKPLYLESETSKIPELKRVIVAHGNQIAMEPTLDAALSRVFGSVQVSRSEALPEPAVVGGRPGREAASPNIRRLVKEAESHLERAKELQRQGDWAGYGEELRKLDRTLRELREKSGG